MEIEEDTLEKDIQLNLKKFQNEYFEKAIKPNIIPTSLKSLESAEEEARLTIEKNLNEYRQNLNHGVDLLLEKVPSNEREELEEVLRLAIGESEDDQIRELFGETLDETNPQEVEELLRKRLAGASVLAKLADKEAQEGSLKDASDMYISIINLFPECDYGWVGLAQTEQKLDHINRAEKLFDHGLTLLPNNFRLCLAAAKFFSEIGKKERATEILNNLIGALQSEKELEVSFLIETAQELLTSIDKIGG